MSSRWTSICLACLCLASCISSNMAQYGSSYIYYTLSQMIQSGALGGCESGTVGPFTPLLTVNALQFRHTFAVPPTVSLSVSSLTSVNAGVPLNFQSSVTAVTNIGASVSFVDANNNVASAYLSYMACPSSTGGSQLPVYG